MKSITTNIHKNTYLKMLEQEFRMAKLIAKHLRRELDVMERQELAKWLWENAANRDLYRSITLNTKLVDNRLGEYGQVDTNEEWERLLQKIRPDHTSIGSFRWKFAVAACFLVLVGISVLLWQKLIKSHADPDLASAKIIKDIAAPIGSNTVLTLANGTRIVIDSVQPGRLASQGNAKITKTINGQLNYTLLHQKPSEVLYNTLATGTGGQTNIVLSDGSKVWLNAASSIRYPAFFTGKDRSVEMTGEGYFEIAPNQSMPFVVKTYGSLIKVLGTHFNLRSYPNESDILTTVLEGKVAVSASGSSHNSMDISMDHSVIVLPGEQAKLVALSGRVNLSKSVDLDDIVAWRQGDFQFHAADLKYVMQEFERWYDIDVVFKNGKAPEIKLSGSVSRKKSLSAVLQLLEISGVKCNIEGRKVIIQAE